MRTAVKLHFPVVHVPFVLSAEIRPWFICSRKEELLRKRAFPAPNKRRENRAEIAAGDTGGITKSDDSHTNVSSLFIFIIFPSPSVCRTSALHGQGKTESSQRSKSGCGTQVVPTLWTSIPRPWENTCPNTEWLCYDVSCRGTASRRSLIQTIWVPQPYRKL